MEDTKINYTDTKYWSDRWNKNQISFHKTSKHPFLEKYFYLFTKDETKIRIFFPLCGKEVDMAWLWSLGHEIIGVECSEVACEQFFIENTIKYELSEETDFNIYKSLDGKIKLYNGDFFKFKLNNEKPFGYIWDRGSLVALPKNLRIKYAEHMLGLLDEKFKYLIDTYDYDQQLYPGPPHSVQMEEIQKLY
ncbi:thiopurine S-methyltransferase, partial [Brachionus plicatilis]